MVAKDKKEVDKDKDKSGALDDFFPPPKKGKNGVDKDTDTDTDMQDGDRLSNISSDVEIVEMSSRKTGEEPQKAEGNEVAEKVVVAKGVTAEEAAIIEAATAEGEAEFTEELGDELPDLPDDGAEAKAKVKDNEVATKKEEVATKDQKTVRKVREPELTRERREDILLGLGFTRYDNHDEKIKFSLLEDNLKVGVTFDAKNPDGNVWAKHQDDKEMGKKGEFLEPQERVELPILKMYYSILKGDEPTPKPTVIGKVVERRGGGVGIEFEEEVGGPKTEYYPLKAVTRDESGRFIPKGFSKAWKDRDVKMHFPRDIRLPNYDDEFAKAEVHEPSRQKEGPDQNQNQKQDKKQEPDKAAETHAKAQNVEDKKKQLSDDWSWAIENVMDLYCTKVKDNVDIHEDLGSFLEKSAVTLFIALQNYRRDRR